MRTVVVGAGPVGLYSALALARRGDQVVVIDRDPGPTDSQTWRRRGVMQFRHPHFFRPTIHQVLLGRTPDVWDALVAAGGIPAHLGGPDEGAAGLQSRRSTFERALREVVAREPNVELRTGLVDGLTAEGGAVTGVRVDGAHVDADRVICAFGRGSHLGDELRAPGEEQPCGFSYVARMYRARPGAPWPEFPLAGSLYQGFQAILFPQDDRTLSALIVRPTADDGLAAIRDTATYESAVAAIPLLAPWTDPDSFEPITDVMVGGRLTNGYRGQLDHDGDVAVAGVHFVGDSVSTTNPSAGRGTSLGLLQADALVGLIEDEPDARAVAQRFDAWCEERIRPWYEDHVYWDATMLRRLAGEDIDVEGRLSSDVVCAAAAEDPSMFPVVGPFLGMDALPASLAAVEDQARAVLRTGWRPPFGEGATRDDVVAELEALAGRAGPSTR